MAVENFKKFELIFECSRYVKFQMIFVESVSYITAKNVR